VPLALRVLGPAGEWRVVSRRGVAGLSRDHGRMGDTIRVTPAGGSEHDWEIGLEYRGLATRSPNGVERPAGTPYQFSYGRFEPVPSWDVGFVAWADSTDPRAHVNAFESALRTPSVQRRESRLDYMWYRPTISGVPQTHFGAVATASVTLPRGTYTLRTISDDGVRVWVDDRLVIDDWTPHESTVDTAPLGGGRHRLRVEYYQVDGWVELRVEIVRGGQRSVGSPGPH